MLLEEMQITQLTLSHHMKIPCDFGVVTSRKEGKWMHYSISKDGMQNGWILIKVEKFDDNWGEDPTGKSDDEFKIIIAKIKSKILQLKRDLT